MPHYGHIGIKKHGHTRPRTPTYHSWNAMKMRCGNPKDRSYFRYGGRGITVCDRWTGREGFQHFLDDMGIRPEGTTLDRRDNASNYELGNCRWATYFEQTHNRCKSAVV